ncbi:DUF3331 domain-containing protein [Paraburkholderia jirisanensis]
MERLINEPDSRKTFLCEAGPNEVGGVSIIEKLSSQTLSVSWSDPRAGRYSEQVWRLGRARFDARCAVSGRPIRRGEAVFRPLSNRSAHPARRDQMILASSVPGYCSESQAVFL